MHTAVATMKTNLGTIKLNLFGNHAPKTVANFTGLASGTKEWTHPATGKVSTDPLYDGVVFHRIIKQFKKSEGVWSIEELDSLVPQLMEAKKANMAAADASAKPTVS